jgi:MSHA biogenesis protein MshL
MKGLWLRWGALSLGLLLLSGCISGNETDMTKMANGVYADIKQHSARPDFEKVERVFRPPIDTTPIVSDTLDWMKQSTSLSVDKRPLSQVMNEFMTNVPGVEMWYGTGVEPSKKISFSAKGTRKEVLNQLTRLTGYGFVAKADSLEVVKYIQKTFPVLLPPGVYSGQQGSQGKQSGTDSNPRIEGQYLNVEYSKVDVFQELADGVTDLLRKDGEKSDDLEGSVKSIPSMATLSVVTTPTRMVMVDQYMTYFEKTLQKQVRIEVQILSYISDAGKERGIDWNIAKDLGGDLGLKFYIPGTNLLSPESGYGLAFTGSGKWSGTQALVRWLDTQGTVSASVPVTQLALNTQPVGISQIQNVPFVDTISSDSSEGVVTADVKRDEKQEGVNIMVTPTVQRDYVWLRATGKYSQIVKTENKVIADTELGFLTTQEAEINFTGKLRYGQSIIIGSTSQRVTRKNKTASYSIEALGGDTEQSRIIETLIILTPRRAG